MKPVGANRGPNFQYNYAKMPSLKAIKSISKVQLSTLTLSISSGVERNSMYSSKFNVPKKSKKSEECLRIFKTAEAPAYALMLMVLRYRSQD
jgi:hypothetical protein